MRRVSVADRFAEVERNGKVLAAMHRRLDELYKQLSKRMTRHGDSLDRLWTRAGVQEKTVRDLVRAQTTDSADIGKLMERVAALESATMHDFASKSESVLPFARTINGYTLLSMRGHADHAAVAGATDATALIAIDKISDYLDVLIDGEISRGDRAVRRARLRRQLAGPPRHHDCRGPLDGLLD